MQLYDNIFYLNDLSLKEVYIFVILNSFIKYMIQRIQSIYLFLAALVSAGLLFAIPVYTTAEGNLVYAVDKLELAMFVDSDFAGLPVFHTHVHV